MKQNLSQIQYEQLAREQFCNRLKEIPFVSDIEVFLEKKNAPLGDFKAKVYLEDSDEPLLFVIEVRSNGEKRFVNHFMEIVMRQDDKTHYIFMAPYISDPYNFGAVSQSNERGKMQLYGSVRKLLYLNEKISALCQWTG